MSYNYNFETYRVMDTTSAGDVSRSPNDYWTERLNKCIESGVVSDYVHLLMDIKDVPGMNETKSTIKLCISKLLEKDQCSSAGSEKNASIGECNILPTAFESTRTQTFQTSISPPSATSNFNGNDTKLPSFAASVFGGKIDGPTESTFSIDILPSVVGWVIGRSGSRIKEIQTSTGCRMWVDQDVPGNQPRKLFFHGPKSSIVSAYALVNKLLESAPVLSGGNFGVTANTVCSAVIDCPVDKVGLLIGRKGWTIKKIMSESGAQISINQSVREGFPRKVIVSGTQESTALAEKYINMILGAKFDDILDDTGDFEDAKIAKVMQMLNLNKFDRSAEELAVAHNPDAIMLMKQFEELRFVSQKNATSSAPKSTIPVNISQSSAMYQQKNNNPHFVDDAHTHTQYFDNLMLGQNVPPRANNMPRANVNMRSPSYPAPLYDELFNSIQHEPQRNAQSYDSRVGYQGVQYNQRNGNNNEVDALASRSVLANGAYLPANYDRHSDYRF